MSYIVCAMMYEEDLDYSDDIEEEVENAEIDYAILPQYDWLESNCDDVEEEDDDGEIIPSPQLLLSPQLSLSPQISNKLLSPRKTFSMVKSPIISLNMAASSTRTVIYYSNDGTGRTKEHNYCSGKHQFARYFKGYTFTIFPNNVSGNVSPENPDSIVFVGYLC